MPKCFSIKISVFLHFYLQSQYKYINQYFRKRQLPVARMEYSKNLKNICIK